MADSSGPIVTVGRIVHYVLDQGPMRGAHRPAIVVRAWGQDEPMAAGARPNLLGVVNLQVVTDTTGDDLPALVWRPLVRHSEAPAENTWHWPEGAP